MLTVGELPRPHAREQLDVFVDRSIAVRAVAAWFSERPAILPNLLRGQTVDVCLPLPDQLNRVPVEPLEIVRGKQQLGPRESQPRHILFDGVDILDVFLGRIGVVETQVAGPAAVLGDTEVQADRFGVADVKIAVRLGWKAGRDSSPVASRGDVLVDDGTDEVDGRRLGRHLRISHKPLILQVSA